MISSRALVLPILAATLSHAADHMIDVGAAGLTYSPSNITGIPIGDTITFKFHPKAHSVTQAAFASPCSPLPSGFDSGLMPVAADATTLPTFQITVKDNSPIWAYCSQQGPPVHCFSGMVFSANAPAEGNTFDKFQAAAMALGSGASASTSALATATATASDSWTSPPPPEVSSLTATITEANSVWTTTYASWADTTPNPTPAAVPAIHTIVVGGDAGLVYTPNTVVAAINDIVVFEYHSKNHTATQSVFNSPCSSIEKSSGGTQFGFDSGFMPVDVGATSFPTYNITVNTTAPIWIHCEQQGPPVHCLSGMVAAINPPTKGNNTFEVFRQLAMHSNVTLNSDGGSNSGSNSTGSSGSGSSGSGSGSGNGAGRAVVSAGLSVGVLGVVVSALL